MTPPACRQAGSLKKEGKNTEIQFIKFLLLLKEEYPDRSVRGR
jgi:hypothetical protein